MFITRNQVKLGGAPFVTFKVYRSRQDKKTIFGYHEFGHQASERAFKIHTTPFGILVEQAFNEARRFADSWGISAIWIDDPDRLFDTALSQ
jgi:hypothetical protein